MSVEFRFVSSRPRIALSFAGAGEAVIFLHGVGTTRSSWDAQLAFFRHTHFAAAWDARGYGDSDDYERDLDFSTDFVADLAAVLDEFGIKSAHLVGLSMGGLIAQCFYFAHPHRVATLVLAHTFPSFGALGEKFVSQFVAARLQPLLEGANPSDHAPATVAALLGPAASAEAKSKFLVSLCGLRKDSYVKTLQALIEEPAPGALEDIRVPTLLLTGEHDRLSPPELTGRMAGCIANSQSTIISNCGHLSNLECPAEFNGVVHPFISRHSGRATQCPT